MDYKIQNSDIALLRNAGVSGDDIKHCTRVAEKALEIAQGIGADIDMELVSRGALFHDLGKAKTHEIEHGKIGAELGGKNWVCEKKSQT
ncbi:MAG: HDIG domain-containing protein [Thermodesulfovibrionia bacterium]|nr:HDIG domain-containing protein [Thermodesulfovibrionia bacterium]